MAGTDDHDDDHDHGHHDGFDTPESVERLEREGEVLHRLTEQAVAALVHHADALGVEVGRVLDVGSGPGIATGLLAESFPGASVVAVDGAAGMVERARSRVAAAGLAPRVEVRQVELPDGLDDLGRADVVWASMVVHHVGDEVAVLERLRALLRPGGLLALVEHSRRVRDGLAGYEEVLAAARLRLVHDAELEVVVPPMRTPSGELGTKRLVGRQARHLYLARAGSMPG